MADVINMKFAYVTYIEQHQLLLRYLGSFTLMSVPASSAFMLPPLLGRTVPFAKAAVPGVGLTGMVS